MPEGMANSYRNENWTRKKWWPFQWLFCLVTCQRLTARWSGSFMVFVSC